MKRFNTRQTLDNWYHRNFKKGHVNKMDAIFKKQDASNQCRSNDKNIRTKYIKGTDED